MVSFYIKDRKKEKSTIRCSVQPSGLKRYHFTVPNSTIYVKEWDEGRMKTGKGKQENSYIQNDLNRIKGTIEKFYSEYYSLHKRYPTEMAFKAFVRTNKSVGEYFTLNKKVKLVEYIKGIKEQRENGRELVNGKKFSYQTISCYNSLILALEGFQKFKKKTHYYIDDMTNIKLIDEFEYYIINEKKMAKNTIHNRLKTLKAFLQIAVNEELIPFNPFKKYKKVLTTEECDVVVFTEQELQDLESLDLSDNSFHDLIRDQYLLYVWSGVRKSDLANFIAVINPTAKSFSFRSSKTGEKSVIPAFETIKRIGQKYNYNFPEPISDVTVLCEIKKICKKIPSMNVTVEKKYTKGGVEVRELKKKYEMVVIHTARRTLATLLADKGLPYHQIMKITGHKKLTTLQKYIKSDADIDQMLNIGNSIGKS
jgi:integrase